jgi:aminopeptidase N
MERKPIADWKPEWNAPLGDARDTQGAMNLDTLRSTRAIRTRAETPGEISQLFDGIAYEKSAAVLRMIEAYVGPDTFRKGINAYLQKYSYGNATAEGFWTEIAVASGKPVDAIMSSLVLQKGLPLINLKTSCSAGRTQVALTQELLSASASSETGLTGSSPVWQLPVCFKRPGGGRTPVMACEILSKPAQTITLDGCSPWLFANANGLGYYRTVYDSDALKALGSALQNGALSDVEQTSLLEDVWALVRIGRENVPNYLALSRQLLQATLTPAVSTVTGRISWIAEHLMEDAERPAFQAWVGALLKPAADRLGWNPLAQDGDDRRSIRASVLNTLGNAGADGDVRREARRRVEVYLSSGGSLDPSLVTTAVNLAAIDGDAALYERYLMRSQESRVPGEQLRFRHALALFNDPALQKRTLEYAMSPAIRTQDRGPFLAAILSNRDSRGRAWEHIKANWASIEQSIGVSFQGLSVVIRAADFCSATARDDVSRFLETHPVRGTERSVQQALESIDSCVSIKNQQVRGLSQFLRSAAPTGN